MNWGGVVRAVAVRHSGQSSSQRPGSEPRVRARVRNQAGEKDRSRLEQSRCRVGNKCCNNMVVACLDML